MKNLHSDHLLDTLLTQAMEDALSALPPWQETETSRKAEDVLASLPKEQNDSLRNYLGEKGRTFPPVYLWRGLAKLFFVPTPRLLALCKRTCKQIDMTDYFD